MEEPQDFYSFTATTSWSVAQIHARAAAVGKEDKKYELFQDYCQCCQNPVLKQPIKLGENVKQLHFLGFGVPLFYLFVQCCIILNLLLIVTDSIYIISKSAINSASKCQNYGKYNTSTALHYLYESQHTVLSGLLRKKPKNVTYQDVDQSLRLECTNLFVYYAEIATEFSHYEQVIRICSIVIHFCCLLFIKSAIIKKNHYFDEIYYREADYSVIFKQLKAETVHKKYKVRQLILQAERQINHHFEIAQILVIPENSFLQQKISKRQKLLETYLQIRQTDNTQALSIKKQLMLIQKDLLFLSSKCKEMIEKDEIDSKNVIIVFEKESDKLKFLQNVKKIKEMTSFQKAGGTIQTRIQQCPDPKEIIWTNLKHTSVRKLKMVFVWFLSLCFLLLTYLIFYQLQSYKNQTIKTAFQMQYYSKEGAAQYREKARIIGWGTLLGIIFYNKLIMSKVLQYLTKLEKHDNVANQDFSFALKYAIGMFFTSSVMKLMVQAVQNHNYYKHDFGIIEEQSMMFVFSAIFLPLIWVIHPLQLLHLFKRYWYKDKQNITQAYANYLAADYPYRIGKRYAQIIEMMWFCFLYVDLIPLGSCFIFIGQCFYYWIDKYNLLRRSSFNYKLSGILSKKMLPLLDFTLVLRFLGAFIFDLQLRQYVNPVTVIMLFVSICFVIVPWEKILQYFDHEDYLLNNERYSKAKQQIFRNKNYISENPIQNFLDLNLVLQRRTHILGS